MLEKIKKYFNCAKEILCIFKSNTFQHMCYVKSDLVNNSTGEINERV